MKKTIMVIGGGLLQTPVIATAKKMGYQVIVTDYNPDAIGMKQADIPIVMSTRDIQGSVRVAKQQNEITPISAVLTVGTDASMTVAAVANALNLPGIKFEDAEAATNKIKMRMRFKEHNVPSPAFLPVWSLSDAKKAAKILGFPLVIKPSDNMGARGVMKIENANQISDAFKFAKSASPSGELIIEQFMEGPELSIDAIIYNGEITITGVADRIIEFPPYFIETGHTMPSSLPPDVINAACDVMKQGIKALGIDIGAAKGDIKITKDGPMIGELAARLSGGFMSAYTYPLSTGVDLMKAAIEVALGQEPGNLEPVFNRVAIERSIICKPGIVKKISGLEEALKIPGIEAIFLNIKEGDMLSTPKSNVEKHGHIIASGKTLQEAEYAVTQCLSVLKIETTTDLEITLKAIQSAAREKFKKICYVCKTCDGKDCPSGVPGMGGIGTGESFRRNSEAIKKYKVITRVIHDVHEPDTSTEIFGKKISIPVMAAPITGSVTNMGGAIEELDYNIAVVKGCKQSGTIAFVGDGATPDKYKIGLQAIEEEKGWGIPIFKPRKDNKEIIMRIKAAEKSGAIACGIDIDAVVFKTMAMKGQEVGPKSLEELKEIKASTKLPFILKGIMSPKDAELACKAGVDAIIVSNHGGRVLDQMPGSMDVLPDIVSVAKDSTIIMIDGGFRDGTDIIKALALGAQYVLIGRPVAIAAVGMGIDGTAYYMNHIKEEVKKVMKLTGCATIKDINSDIIMKV
ncbi:MAG: L-lactate dehydrogenase (cytochrome) [Spirochaetes bacterium ADurb.Bin218]|jgi:biotin carboxylase/NAD(P)H-dependent flavin oxidoreductase YrpB (nitropropane dioxygenase family)|nr:MAG: L-lactate dehydrogenase (cytochrome) [Spirochaetes bacterium ADurb.Bin218]HOQ12329.1 alpha-hydroxy-acid oxidizing protein [Spirochaetota bacterium]HOV09283.1 alpha-hydroxy-acid oxidizing protein [Spirochaetota bacterium]HPX91745.1 alpha-hydroxy-acid oxidizing protein [Spirochaetota bacterium]